MFAIALQQDQYKTYILSDQLAQTRLEVVPERGGLITRWVVQGHDILYLDAERFANPALSVRGGIPILFPICGNLPDNTFTHGGTPYLLKQHGFARDLPWEVRDRITQGYVGLTLALTSTTDTRAVYPFDFELVFTYRLRGNSLELHQQVVNTGSEPLPFSLGLHPYFEVADKSALQFDLPVSQYLDQRTQISHPYLGGFDFELDEIDVLFREVAQPSATATDSKRKLQIQLNYEMPYTCLVFWTVKGKDFYCLEPWTAPRNALNTGDRLICLDPGQTLETTTRLTATFL